MAQIKIYGVRSVLGSRRAALSDVIHASAVAAFAPPEDKRFHRFIGLDPEDFIYPAGRTSAYTIVEIVMFEGRSVATKKKFYAELYARAHAELGLGANDLEVSIIDTPRHDWAIRGQPGDELQLNYQVNVD